MTTKAKTLQNLYNRKRVSITGLRKAVVDGTITAEEFKTITGEEYEA